MNSELDLLMKMFVPLGGLFARGSTRVRARVFTPFARVVALW